jgi:hypothetical protein
MSQQSSPFEKVQAAMEILSLLASGGGGLSQSEVKAEIQNIPPAQVQEISRYENLPEIMKSPSLEDQLESQWERSQEKKREEEEQELETSLLVATQPGTLDPPPAPEIELPENQDNAETPPSAQIISLLASSLAAQSEGTPESELTLQAESNSEVEATSEASIATESLSESEEESESESNGESEEDSGDGGER